MILAAAAELAGVEPSRPNTGALLVAAAPNTEGAAVEEGALVTAPNTEPELVAD